VHSNSKSVDCVRYQIENYLINFSKEVFTRPKVAVILAENASVLDSRCEYPCPNCFAVERRCQF